MKAVIHSVPEHILEARRRTGADRWDEMWNGVLHMGPVPDCDHQDFKICVVMWLRIHWAPRRRAKVYAEINVAKVGGWDHDYRVPDLVILLPDRFHINRRTHFEGAPSVVIEIRSPGDASYEKLEFYAQLGVPEVWIIDRDTKIPELRRLKNGSYETMKPDANGWLLSEETGLELRQERPGKLGIRFQGDAPSAGVLPED